MQLRVTIFPLTTMTPPPEKTDPTTFSEGESQNKLMDSEIREMVSALTHRLSDLQNQSHKNHHPIGSKKSHHNYQSEQTGGDDFGARVITLAGSNTGAFMRGELASDKSSSPFSAKNMDPTSGSYVNSNFQAINNSIMMGGSYSSNDPGVHMDITDYERDGDHVVETTMKHKGKVKGKKKEEGVSKSDHHRSEPDSD